MNKKKQLNIFMIFVICHFIRMNHYNDLLFSKSFKYHSFFKTVQYICIGYMINHYEINKINKFIFRI